MGKTVLDIRGTDFYINGAPVYQEIPGAGSARGLLMNARFIQGVFDDAADRSRFHRFGRTFSPEANTAALIAALPQWYEYGLRAVTVGFQGGWPVFTVDVRTIDNNPFGPDGRKLDEAYAARMDRIIRAADELGMVVIANMLYWAQALKLRDGMAVAAAVKNAAAFLKNGGYTNVLVDVANEHDISQWQNLAVVKNPQSMQLLIDMVRRESGGLPVGSSGGGGCISQEVADVSDVVIVHGNGLTRGDYYNFIRRVQAIAPGKPVLCNEDSPCISRLDVAQLTHTSWGHYDNFTKQEPPADFGITAGQDTYFARRMAGAVGITLPELPLAEQFYLEGLEGHTDWQGKRWLRLAAEYPEQVDRVRFFRNGELIYTAFDEPFFLFGLNTWMQRAWDVRPDDREWTAEVVLRDGKTVVKTVQVG